MNLHVLTTTDWVIHTGTLAELRGLADQLEQMPEVREIHLATEPEPYVHPARALFSD